MEYLLREEWSMKHIKLPIYLDKAIELGLASLDDNTFRHPHTGEVTLGFFFLICGGHQVVLCGDICGGFQ